ncbi:MAG: TatD family hydrolase [Clostridiales bacterium]|nr:TatD family hydrolase [Clostridiales bacterium]
MLFDSHAHINDADTSDQVREAVIAAIEKSEMIDYVADIGCDLATSKMAVDHSNKYSWCFAVVGCHPHEAKDMDDMQLAMIKGLAKKDKAVAIGEIGLDFHYDFSPRDVQREWFRRQIRLANELKMPIVVHSREADQEVMDILKEEGAFSLERKSWFSKRPDPTGYVNGSVDALSQESIPSSGKISDAEAETCDDARVLLHCFSGSRELARQYVKLGATVSIAGPVTYKNNKKTVGVVEEIPFDFLLVETDSPYLTPEPFRGKRNTPLMVEHTVRKLAEIKGMNFEDVADRTKVNAMRFYGVKR